MGRLGYVGDYRLCWRQRETDTAHSLRVRLRAVGRLWAVGGRVVWECRVLWEVSSCFYGW